jgi:hypothetical protein
MVSGSLVLKSFINAAPILIGGRTTKEALPIAIGRSRCEAVKMRSALVVRRDLH